MKRTLLQSALLAAAATLLGACGMNPGRLFTSHTTIEVREIGRSLYCNTPGDAPMVQLLPDTQAALDWQAARGVSLAGAERLGQSPYAIVEMGSRPTGGYGLAVARAAELRGELLVLQATFVSPAAGTLRTQAISTPCVLVQLPRGRYHDVEVQDQSGAVRVRGDTLAPPAPVAPAPASSPEGPPVQ